MNFIKLYSNCYSGMLICSSTHFISLMALTSSPKLDASLVSESSSVLLSESPPGCIVTSSSLSVNSSLSLLGAGTSDLKCTMNVDVQLSIGVSVVKI